MLGGNNIIAGGMVEKRGTILGKKAEIDDFKKIGVAGLVKNFSDLEFP